jgi:hypothetical protein
MGQRSSVLAYTYTYGRIYVSNVAQQARFGVQVANLCQQFFIAAER